MLDGKCGDILLCITENIFVIKAMKMFNLKRQHCEEFYEVYNGVSPDYLVWFLFIIMHLYLGNLKQSCVEHIHSKW